MRVLYRRASSNRPRPSWAGSATHPSPPPESSGSDAGTAFAAEDDVGRQVLGSGDRRMRSRVPLPRQPGQPSRLVLPQTSRNEP
eukprot:9254319-Alexandrium_andersonii.AAC.1